ncbi:ATP-binding cassette domain-containing protein [Actinomyces gaoshouyii]|uniref:ABC transporter ATP-binding protein n=1 Tax=Actinomyces gaoshouyii TaxID=1960083 RepID=A0A8H9LJ72_9ACTO|nr:ATP-binding cassette domain-containing protein [Actinomyces gaoshouyii]GGO98205.1 ABC transporter ATP-binding protein [Actinomyces gaoshouyii]
MDMLLELNDFVVSRGRKFSLSPVNIRFNDPNIVGLFGHNGAGKTTLLKALSGLLPVQSGESHIKDMSYPVFLPDTPFIYKFLKVGSVPGVLAKYFNDFDADLGESIIGDLSLDVKKRVGELSKGMEEQLNLGMTLARRSSVYLFDEPLAAVDPVTRDHMLDLIKRYKPNDALLIISTHLISGLESLFDECLVLHNGKILLRISVSDSISNNQSLESRIKEAMINA